MRPMHQPELRRSRRVKIGQLLKVCPSDPKDEHFEDVSRTKNVSREGIYFITRRESYYPGMRLFVTLPYYSPTDPRNCEYIAQVVRVEQLGSGQRGVAALLLSSVSVKPKTTHTGARRQ